MSFDKMQNFKDMFSVVYQFHFWITWAGLLMRSHKGKILFLTYTKIILSLASLGLTSEFLLSDCCFAWIGLTWLGSTHRGEWWVQSRYFGSNSMYYFTVLKDFSIKGENHRWWFWKKIELLSWANLGRPFILNPWLT
jgi:hypothetical protein